MLTTGIVKQVIIQNNKAIYRVRLPLFETAGQQKEFIAPCNVCYAPGNVNFYQEGDRVYVDFLCDSYSSPIIIGKIYRGEEEEATNASFDSTIEVTKRALLPENTTIGDLTLQDIKNMRSQIEQYQDTFDIINNEIDDIQEELDNIDIATSSEAGLVKLGSDVTQTEAAQTPSATENRTYAVQTNSSGQMVVNVPWSGGGSGTDTWRNIKVNDTEILGTGISTGAVNFEDGTNVSLSNLNGTITISATDTTYNVATSSVAGLVKSSTTGTTSGRDYNVEVNSNGTMKVNVPWENTVNGIALYNTEGLVKPAYTTTGTATLSTTSQAYTNSPTIESRSTVLGKYYAVEADSVGRMYVNVPWTDKIYYYCGSTYGECYSLDAPNSNCSIQVGDCGFTLDESTPDNQPVNTFLVNSMELKWNGVNIIPSASYSSGLQLTTGSASYYVPVSLYNKLGVLKPAYTSTNTATLTTASASNTDTPTLAAKTTTSNRYYAIEADKNGVPYVNVPWENTTYSVATSSVAGLVKSTTTGTTSGRNYNVEVNSDGTMKVNVPWTDKIYLYTSSSYGDCYSLNGPNHYSIQIGDSGFTVDSEVPGEQGNADVFLVNDTRLLWNGTSVIPSATYSTGLPISSGSVSLFVPITLYNTLGVVKPAYTSTNSVTLTTASASNSNSPVIEAKTTTLNRYYAVEADKNGVLYVNVPWQPPTSSYNSGLQISSGSSSLYVPDSSTTQKGATKVADTITSSGTDPVQGGVIYTALNNKQDTLVSGVNIKTINSNSIVGAGDLTFVSQTLVTENMVASYANMSSIFNTFMRGYYTVSPAIYNVFLEKEGTVSSTKSNYSDWVDVGSNWIKVASYTFTPLPPNIVIGDITVTAAAVSGGTNRIVSSTLENNQLKVRVEYTSPDSTQPLSKTTNCTITYPGGYRAYYIDDNDSKEVIGFTETITVMHF